MGEKGAPRRDQIWALLQPCNHKQLLPSRWALIRQVPRSLPNIGAGESPGNGKATHTCHEFLFSWVM